MGSKTAIVLVLVFALALLGGGAVGMLAARHFGEGKTSVQPIENAGLPLSQELQLTSDQRENIKKIWEGMRRTGDNCVSQIDWLNHQRDDDIQKILTPDQLTQFKELSRKYQDQCAALLAKRQQAFNDAVEETKKLLNPIQRARYESILAQRMGQSMGEEHHGPQQGTARSENSSFQSVAKLLSSPG